MKKFLVFALTAIGVMGATSLFAADGQTVAAALGAAGTIALAAGLGTGIAAIGTGIGQGLATKGAVEGMARNPEAAGTIRVNMIIGLALIESLAIYALVVALMLFYAFPFNESIMKIIAG